MKRQMMMLLGGMMALSMYAQVVQENELAMVYYMPKTRVWVDVEYEQVIQTPGRFKDYAAKYLAATDIVTENDTTYTLIKASCGTSTVADHTRAYKVVAETGIEAQLLSLTPKGTLAGYNLPKVGEEGEEARRREGEKARGEEARRQNGREGEKAKGEKAKGEKVKGEEARVMPLFGDQIVGKTPAQMAEGAAKQIYRIRETRLYILAGEVDHAPADGVAMKRVLQELDDQERELTELFIGTTRTRKVKKSYYYTPVTTEEVPLAQFSTSQGIVTENGDTITLRIEAKRQSLAPNTSVPNKKAPVPSQLYYNIPGSANLTVLYHDEVMAEKTIAVAQFGIAVPFARDLFTGKTLPVITIHPLTGNIQSICK